MGAVSSNNTEHSSTWAVTRITCATQVTHSAAGVYFTDDSSAHERTIRRCLHQANKLVPESSLEPSITSRDFQVGVADSGKQDANESLRSRLWFFNFAHSQLLFF